MTDYHEADEKGCLNRVEKPRSGGAAHHILNMIAATQLEAVVASFTAEPRRNDIAM